MSVEGISRLGSPPAYDWIAHHAFNTPDRLAVVDLHSGRRFSYGQFDERIGRLARVLTHQYGVARGDRVAVLANNAVEVFEVQFACARLGAIFLPLNWRLAVPELEFICTDATPKLLILGDNFADAAQQVAALSRLPATLELAYGAASPYEAALAEARGELPHVPLVHDDIWTLIYTSGTTGRPKGALITYGMMFFNCVHAAMTMRFGADSRTLTFLPTFHIGGLCVFANPAFHFGAAVWIMRTFDPADFLRLIADKTLALTHVFGVPTNFLFTSQQPGFAEADLSHLVAVGIGGAAAPIPLLETYARKGVMFQQGWGMTETATIGTILPPDKALTKIGSSGLPVMHTQIRIVDPEGRDLPHGSVGELLIKGPTITPGYWNRPEANTNSFTDGWFHTGDAARADAEGYITIVDRWKDMFISGGENVYPVEVENAIFQLDGVAEAAVIGVPDDKWGEVGRAFVVTRPGSNLTEPAVLSHCKTQLASYKVPKSVRFLAELPHNATGKVTKHQLPRD